RYGGMGIPELRRQRHREQENARLKRLLAERDLEVDALRELLGKKTAGADGGPDGAAAGGGAGGAGAEAAASDGAGGLPRAPERGGPEVPRQHLPGQTPGRQIPAAGRSKDPTR